MCTVLFFVVARLVAHGGFSPRQREVMGFTVNVTVNIDRPRDRRKRVINVAGANTSPRSIIHEQRKIIRMSKQLSSTNKNK